MAYELAIAFTETLSRSMTMDFYTPPWPSPKMSFAPKTEQFHLSTAVSSISNKLAGDGIARFVSRELATWT
jgi:hypothetical protein